MNPKMHKDMNEFMSRLSPPAHPLPHGAWDVHSHVFGPYDVFPLAPAAVYQPPLAPYRQYIELLDRVGFAHGVLVHPSAMGFDNSAMLDALRRSKGRLRGVAVVSLDTSDKELADMHQVGVRGLRFTMSRQMAAATTGVLKLEDLRGFAPRLRELEWHAQIWAPADIIAENSSILRSLDVPIVFDHMGQFDVAKGVADAGFEAMVDLARDGIAWIKTTAFRNSKTLPAMDDVRPFHERLVDVASSQLLWGSDWPFIGMGDAMPDVAQLLARLREWSGDDVIHRILVDNPQALYA
jgi:2-pyrone-4,6-dicarboxylate lactonase